MKHQVPCPAMCVMPGFPGFALHADDGVRLLRALARPVIVAIVIGAIGAAILLGGRSLAPFMIGGGLGSPGPMAGLSADESPAERELRAEADLLLQSFESAPPDPAATSELP